jgi:dihydroorotate dehydrogenase electron transfer subunit
VGPGTEELSELDVGGRVSVLGPLGRGFEEALYVLGADGAPSPRDETRRLLVVAGGVGAAPFAFLLEELARRGREDSQTPRDSPAEVVVLLGFRDDIQAEVIHLFREPADLLKRAGVAVRLEAIAEDGSLGRSGLVTTLLREELRPADRVVVCGAHAMCESVWDLCLDVGRVEAWFSLEAGMACGIGSCQGCVLPMADGSLVKVCRQGPVFSGEEAFGEQRHPCALPAEEA